MTTWVLDTSVAVDHLRGLEPATELLVGIARAGETLAASELVRFELLVGARSSESAPLEEFLRTVLWIPVTEPVARVGARMAQRFRRSHSGIDDVDYLIAATTIVLDADLLTTNVRHYPMLPELSAAY